jgi:hypothetical protein
MDYVASVTDRNSYLYFCLLRREKSYSPVSNHISIDHELHRTANCILFVWVLLIKKKKINQTVSFRVTIRRIVVLNNQFD